MAESLTKEMLQWHTQKHKKKEQTKMPVLTLKQQIDSLELLEKKQAQISQLMKEKRVICVSRYSPVQIGDVVRANQYSYSGRKIKIDRLIMTKRGSVSAPYYEFQGSGHIVNNNGDIGKPRADWAVKVVIGDTAAGEENV